jgi:SAM-dependent methyltransferase
MSEVEARTGRLFGDLWHKLDDEQFEQSVALFASRFKANGFDLSWLKGKQCLDVGCGGGRYTIAMSRLGAGQVVGCDISDDGLANARLRAEGLPNVNFEKASALDLPFDDESFDFVFSSGVLHHTTDPDRGLDELTRVLRPGGYLYLMLYGGGGLRWAASMAVRPCAQELGVDFIDKAIGKTGLPANNRRHFLDDFFAPIVEFVTWESLLAKLEARGYGEINRWGRDDHDAEANLKDVSKMVMIFSQAVELAKSADPKMLKLAEEGLATVTGFHHQIEEVMAACERGEISRQTVVDKIIGEQIDDNHRVVARKLSSV